MTAFYTYVYNSTSQVMVYEKGGKIEFVVVTVEEYN